MTSSTDYYQQWTELTDAELSVGSSEKIIGSIPDNLWVAAACFERLVDDASVQRVLLETGIKRTDAAVTRCKDVVADSSTTTEDHFSALEEHFQTSSADAQLCGIRSILLSRLDRLNTFIEICKEANGKPDEDVEEDIEEWEDDPWQEEQEGTSAESSANTPPPITLSDFLTEDLSTSARILALKQQFNSLQVLLERHGPWSKAERFSILNAIPFHAQPTQYHALLPTVDSNTGLEHPLPYNPWRQDPDWSETITIQSAIKSAVPAELSLALGESNYASIPKGAVEVLSAEELSQWYTDRMSTVMTHTGMIDLVLALVQHGASGNVPGLDEAGENLSLYSRLVYEAGGGEDESWTFEAWKQLDPPAAIRAYLSYSTPETVAANILRLVWPYLYVLESHAERAGKPDPGLPTRLLYDYILQSPLNIVAAIFEESKPTLPLSQRIIRDDADMVRLALACLYGSGSINDWSTMSNIFECLPAWNIAKDQEDEEDAFETTLASLSAFLTPKTSSGPASASDLLMFFKPLPLASLSHALDILDVHLESGEILSRWDVARPLRWFLQSFNNMEEQRSLAYRMARRAGGVEDQVSTVEDWQWLLDDMLKLSAKGNGKLRGAFGLLSHDEIHRMFLAGVLSTGQFDAAKTLINSRKINLSADDVEELCLAASREFYDNASSGNYNFGDMKLSYECLNVASPSDTIAREKEFIEATSRLSSFNVTSRSGIPLSPIEIRLTKDRLSLIARVLSSNDDAYKHTEYILELVQKLGFRDDVVAEVKTLAMITDTALQAEDFKSAVESSERMIEIVTRLRASNASSPEDPSISEAAEVCWVSCFQLGRQSEFEDTSKKVMLLGRALELCPADRLHEILTAWRRLEKEDIESRQEQLAQKRKSSSEPSGSFTRPSLASIQNNIPSLRDRLRDFHMPSPQLLNSPDAAALASKTFRSVTANFPFARGRSQLAGDDASERSASGSRRGFVDTDQVSAQAGKVFSKGIGWLLGADEQ